MNSGRVSRSNSKHVVIEIIFWDKEYGYGAPGMCANIIKFHFKYKSIFFDIVNILFIISNTTFLTLYIKKMLFVVLIFET